MKNNQSTRELLQQALNEAKQQNLTQATDQQHRQTGVFPTINAYFVKNLRTDYRSFLPIGRNI